MDLVEVMPAELYAGSAVVGQVPDSLRKELNNVCKACFTGKHTVPDGDKLASFRDQFISSLDPTVITDFPVCIA